jgi:hypothetical protein
MSQYTSAGRIPEFETKAIEQLGIQANVLKQKLINAIEANLSTRNHAVSYDPADRSLFEPAVDFSATINLQQTGMYSYVFYSLLEVKELVEQYETTHCVKVNKSDLYFSLAYTSALNNATINSSTYWELCITEESQATGASYNPVTALRDILSRMTIVTTSVELGLEVNNLYNDLKVQYTWIGGFAHNLLQLTDPSIFSYFACGLRNRTGSGWLNTPGIEMPKMYAQELINALCILTEATLKLRPALTPFSHRTIGTLFTNLDAQNPAVSALVGKPGPTGGLFATYPTTSQSDFNANFPRLISAIKTGTQTDDEVKAHLLYGAYMLRNKVLHNFDSSLVYYNDVSLFYDAIAIAFGAVSAALSI